jgi:dihydroxyacetone kinase-like protein
VGAICHALHHLGERSIGHQDPGATSSALIIRALAEVV